MVKKHNRILTFLDPKVFVSVYLTQFLKNMHVRKDLGKKNGTHKHINNILHVRYISFLDFSHKSLYQELSKLVRQCSVP